MDANQIGGLIAVLLLFVLPVAIGLLLIIKAEAMARSQIRWLSREDVEPSAGAIIRFRLVGGIFIALPIFVFLMGALAMSQHP